MSERVLMKTRQAAITAVLVVGSLLMAASPSYAWWHRGWWVPPFWVVPPPAIVVAPAPAPVVVAPAPVIESAPVYAEQAPPQGYWYYCASSRAYYPSVPTCAEAWVKVPPRAQQ
jgi:hypothetical protein